MLNVNITEIFQQFGSLIRHRLIPYFVSCSYAGITCVTGVVEQKPWKKETGRLILTISRTVKPALRILLSCLSRLQYPTLPLSSSPWTTPAFCFSKTNTKELLATQLLLPESKKSNDSRANIIIMGAGAHSVMLSISLSHTVGDVFKELRRRHLIPHLTRTRHILYFDSYQRSPLCHEQVLCDIDDPDGDSESNTDQSANLLSVESTFPKSASGSENFSIQDPTGHSFRPIPFEVEGQAGTEYFLKLEGRAPVVDIPGHSELWKGKIYQPTTSSTMVTVAVKYPISLNEHLKILKNEIRTYKCIQHPNVAPFYGTHVDDGMVALVIPWYQYSAATYIKKFQIDPLTLIIQLAEAICYLHSRKIYHGDLKASNLMIDENGDLKLIDFGLSRIDGEEDISCNRQRSFRWTPPELVASDDVVTAASDVYSFASTALELLTGNYPYDKIRNFSLLFIILNGGRPREYTTTDGCSIPDALWDILEQCWGSSSSRPSMDSVLTQLHGYTRNQLKGLF